MRRFVTFVAPFLMVCLAAAPALAQPAHHNIRQDAGIKAKARNDSAAQVLTIQLGPVNLPAHGAHTQSPILSLTIPIDGWLTAYDPRLVDDEGTSLPRRLLHHAIFFNSSRRDLTCSRRKELFFAAGREKNTWPVLPGVGYRIRNGDRILMRVMFHNPTDTPFPQTYLEVHMKYKLISDSPPLQSVYPAWFLVGRCAKHIDYDLKPGENVHASEVTVGYGGRLLWVAGHMHNYGRSLRLENVTQQAEIATLNSTLDPRGRLLSMSAVLFDEDGGYRLNRGDLVKVTAAYDNPTGKLLPRSGMGMVVGAFLPDSDEELASLKLDKK